MCLSAELLSQIEAKSINSFISNWGAADFASSTIERVRDGIVDYRQLNLLSASKYAGILTSQPTEVPRRYQFLIGIAEAGESHIDNVLTANEAQMLYTEELEECVSQLANRGLKLATEPPSEEYKTVLALCYQQTLLDNLEVTADMEHSAGLELKLNNPAMQYERVDYDNEKKSLIVPDIVPDLINTHDMAESNPQLSPLVRTPEKPIERAPQEKGLSREAEL